jgi:hypothetical protein
MAIARKIMLIRHAEKPEGPVQGVDANGNEGKEFLTVQGWQARRRACQILRASERSVSTSGH